jgi:hypothetical protein
MPDPARKHHSLEETVMCHAFPLACSGVSAARSAVRRSSTSSPSPEETSREDEGAQGKGVRRMQAIPECTPGCCYLFEEIHPDLQGSEL